MRFIKALSFVATLSLTFVASVTADTIRVGAAISMKDALGEIAKSYQQATGDTVEMSFGSSGQIQQQIKSGAEIDLFISAANKQVDELTKEGLVDEASRRVVVQNTLVLVVPAAAKDAPASFAGLADAKVTKVAIGEPKTVPAGQYATQVLKSLNIEAALADRLVYGTNVRQVLTYVERGEVAAGIVYASDAKESGDKVRVVATAEPNTHEPIVYPAVVVKASKKPEAAKRFLDFVMTAESQAVLKNRGFTPVDLNTAAPAAK